jgi:hypothetical protein
MTNGTPPWPTARSSGASPSDKVGCVRRFHLTDGSELREQLLTLSDADMAFSYCLLDTPVPLLNYVAHVRLAPVTDEDWTFWHWESRFDTPKGRETELHEMVAENIYQGGFDAIRAHMGLERMTQVETYPTLEEAARALAQGGGLSWRRHGGDARCQCGHSSRHAGAARPIPRCERDQRAGRRSPSARG